MAFTPTEEQLAIVARAQTTDNNILISALAGAAKTSSLVLLAEALPDVEMLCLAFNKRIATEMQERLPRNCKAMTLNSLGHRTWSDATGRRLKIDKDKTYNILKELTDEISDRREKDLIFKNFGELLNIINLGKTAGYVPTGTYDRAKRLMDDESFFESIEQNLSPAEIDIVRAATLISLKQSFEGLCDYNDQILMPTVFHGAFPRYPLVLIDEAQDLSALNHATLRKMVKKRLIAVGDPNQAIYGFRGAHEDSMSKLQQDFNMQEMTLSTSFRCPKAIVRHVHWKTPTMRHPDWAKEGSVTTLDSWNAESLPEAAAILCRNNAPLFSTAIRLLLQGRPCEIGGNDVVKGITRVMRKFGGSDLRQVDVLDRIELWQEEQFAKHKKYAHNGIADRAECMRIFARQGDTLGDALAYAQHLVQLHSPLKLLTGHKAKGLEFDHVFILDVELIGKEDQEPNLRYVMDTRAKDTLTYIESKGFVKNGEV